MGGGCLIATAAHGTALAPQVQALREYRDGALLATGYGSASMSAFSAAYCPFSPYVADLEREHPTARQAAALIVTILFALSVAALADHGSEASVAAHGVAVVLPATGLTSRPGRGGRCAPALEWAGAARRHAYRFARRPERQHRTRRSRNAQKGAATLPRTP